MRECQPLMESAARLAVEHDDEPPPPEPELRSRLLATSAAATTGRPLAIPRRPGLAVLVP